MNSVKVKRELQELIDHYGWSNLKASQELNMDRRTIGRLLSGEAKAVRKPTADRIGAAHSKTFTSDVSVPSSLWQAARTLRIPTDIVDFALTARLRTPDSRDEAFWTDLMSAISVYPNLFESNR